MVAKGHLARPGIVITNFPTDLRLGTHSGVVLPSLLGALSLTRKSRCLRTAVTSRIKVFRLASIFQDATRLRRFDINRSRCVCPGLA